MDSEDIPDDNSEENPTSRSGLTPSSAIPIASSRRNEGVQGYSGISPSVDAATFLGYPATPPRAVSLEEITQAALNFSDMALCHEIAIDSDFTLDNVLKEESYNSEMERRFRETMERAYWQHVEEELTNDPPSYSRVSSILVEMKEELKNCLFPHQSRRKEYFDEILDSQLIQQQAEKGVLNVPHYTDVIISNMGELCAPHLDDEIQQLRELKQPVEILQRIFKVLKRMKLDVANFTIRQFRPHIVASAVEYEKEKFKNFLKTLCPEGSMPLANMLHHTYTWLTRASEKLSEEDRKNINKVVPRAYVDLLRWETMEGFPETVLTDEERFKGLQKESFRLCSAATILLMVYSNGGANVQDLKEFKKTMKDHIIAVLGNAGNSEELKEVLPSIAAKAIQNLNNTLEAHGFGKLDSQVESVLQGQILSVSDKENRIRILVRNRLEEFLVTLLAMRTGGPQRVETIKIPTGFSSLNDELSKLSMQFYHLASHNRAVFGSYYTDLLTK